MCRQASMQKNYLKCTNNPVKRFNQLCPAYKAHKQERTIAATGKQGAQTRVTRHIFPSIPTSMACLGSICRLASLHQEVHVIHYSVSLQCILHRFKINTNILLTQQGTCSPHHCAHLVFVCFPLQVCIWD